MRSRRKREQLYFSCIELSRISSKIDGPESSHDIVPLGFVVRRNEETKREAYIKKKTLRDMSTGFLIISNTSVKIRALARIFWLAGWGSVGSSWRQHKSDNFERRLWWRKVMSKMNGCKRGNWRERTRSFDRCGGLRAVQKLSFEDLEECWLQFWRFPQKIRGLKLLKSVPVQIRFEFLRNDDSRSKNKYRFIFQYFRIIGSLEK